MKYHTLDWLLIAFLACSPGMIACGDDSTTATINEEPAERCAQIQASFAAFPDVTVTCDDVNAYVESDAWPDHEMMTGITRTIQHVPLPFYFTGDNAMKIPLSPVLTFDETQYDGPIAVAINGVPIFDYTNVDDYSDAKAQGELDICNGHAGRGEDYHYHAAPVCMMDGLDLGPEDPLGWAFDGFPIYGFTNADGSTPELDACNGEEDESGYHYHTSEEAPYIVRCLQGEVDTTQFATTRGFRLPQPPLVGVTDMKWGLGEDGWYHMTWKYEGLEMGVAYTLGEAVGDDYCYDFKLTDTSGNITEETYCRNLSQ